MHTNSRCKTPLIHAQKGLSQSKTAATASHLLAITNTRT